MIFLALIVGILIGAAIVVAVVLAPPPQLIGRSGKHRDKTVQWNPYERGDDR